MASPAAQLSKRISPGRTLTGSSSGGEGWGMGFFLVFFPQEKHHHQPPLFKSPLIKRTNSTNILAKAQSTISVCALVIFFTLLLFTLCTFEPSNTTTSRHYRRHLSQSYINFHTQSDSPAFQRLGTLYSRGTKPMNTLVLCHVPETTTLTELKSFLRAFHRSGLLPKSDLLFIFPSITTPELSDTVIREENNSFMKIIRRYKSELSNRSSILDFPASFDVSQFVKSENSPEKGEPIWGRKAKNYSSNSSTEVSRTSYGSVVGFGVGEVDPENSLSGFIDQIPMSLRRWAAYPMILGRLRRSFKHVMLVNVKEVLLLGDPLAGIGNCRPESVFLSHTKHHRKTTINPAVIVGGARGVRRLSAAMLTEIVRATSHKKKTPVTETALLSRLVTSEFVQKNIHLVDSAELIHEASSLGGVEIANSSRILRRGNSNLDVELTKRICSFSIDALVYTECRKVQPF